MQLKKKNGNKVKTEIKTILWIVSTKIMERLQAFAI